MSLMVKILVKPQCSPQQTPGFYSASHCTSAKLLPLPPPSPSWHWLLQGHLHYQPCPDPTFSHEPSAFLLSKGHLPSVFQVYDFIDLPGQHVLDGMSCTLFYVIESWAAGLGFSSFQNPYASYQNRTSLSLATNLKHQGDNVYEIFSYTRSFLTSTPMLNMGPFLTQIHVI